MIHQCVSVYLPAIVTAFSLMKIKQISPILFSVLCTCYSYAQDVYPFWKDDSLLKESSYKISLEKKKQWLAAAGKPDADTYRKIYDQQFREITDIWQSSRSVTAPPAHQYLQQLFAHIKKSNPAIAESDARVIFTRDWWPNAYSMGEGTIVINAGLLTWLRNEAQLAFILCHELAHYHLDHSGKSVKRYVDTMNSAAVQQELKRLSKDKYRVNQQLEALAKGITFNNRRHNREYEQAADHYALSLMKQTGFDITQSVTTLELLDKIDELLAARPLDLQAVLNQSAYPFRQKWIQAESGIFSQLKASTNLTEQEKDSLKTHPDCRERIAAMQQDTGAQIGQQLFFTSNENFERLKSEMYIEMMERCYQDNNLSRHLYFALSLLQHQPFQPVAAYAVARGLNTVYQRQKNHKLGLSVDAENKTFPEDYNLLLRMLNRIRLEEMVALNLAFCNSYNDRMSNYPAFRKEHELARQLHKEQVNN